jgi:hypothetical protein
MCIVGHPLDAVGCAHNDTPRAGDPQTLSAGVEGSIVLAKVRESKDKNFGYNAATDEYEDLVKAGVIDPTKVTRTALQNAASIAGLLLTTECVVVEKKEVKSAPAGGLPGGERSPAPGSFWRIPPLSAHLPGPKPQA